MKGRRKFLINTALTGLASIIPKSAVALLRGSPAVINPDIGYTLTFVDDFVGALSISDNNPATTWIWNKPDGGNFGGVGWSDVFSTAGGILTISAKTVGGVWHAGIMSTVKGPQVGAVGFAQKFGYFECRMWIPAALGSNFPAFWLLSQAHIADPLVPSVEIDIIEQLGDFNPTRYNFTYHDEADPSKAFQWGQNGVNMSDGYHLYGVSIEDDFMIWYFDRRELGRVSTPPNAKQKVFPLVDLALSTYPTPNPLTPDPVNLLVDYVRVWQKN